MSSARTRLLRRRVAMVGLGALTLAGCGIHPSVSIGIRATALDLRFARPDLAKPIPPVIVQEVLPRPSAPPAPAPASLPPGVVTPVRSSTSPVTSTPTTVPVLVPPSSCPTPAGAHPGALAQSTSSAPLAGVYAYATKGTATVTGGSNSSSTTENLPATTHVQVSTPNEVPADSTTAQAEGTSPNAKETEYTVTTYLGSTIKQVDVTVVTPIGLDLVSRTYTDGERTVTYAPEPEVSLMRFGPVGTSWKTSGTDQASGATITDQGSIAAETTVQVCGQTVKAYEVQSSQQFVDPLNIEIIQTNDSDPNSFVIAPQLGGLVVGGHVDYTDRRYISSQNGFVGITLDYSTTVDSLVPAAGGAP